MSDSDLRDELRRLADRVGRLERLFDLEAIESEASPDVEPMRPPGRPTPPPPPLASAAPPPVASAAQTRPALREPEVGRRLIAASAARVAAPPTAPPRPAAPASPAADRTSIELAIGGRWMAWVGALAVVVGIGLFIKFAYDEGWLRGVSIAMRCALSAAFGLVLLAVGEVALRRISRYASIGLFGAGLGTLYVTTLVSFRIEVLGSAGLTLILLALVAVLGVGIAVRAGLLSIAIVSIIAGYGAPLLVPDAGGFRAGSPTYLTMLLAVGLALSALRPRPFRTLRIVVLAAHAIVATMWIVGVRSGSGLLELTFLSGWWMMVTGEAVWAALRRQSPMGNAIQSLMATAWYVLFGCTVLHTAGGVTLNLAGAFASGVGVLAAAIALQFGPGIEALRRRPQIAIDKLAASLWAQSGALLVIGAGLHFGDYGTTVAWLVMALAAIEIGRRLPSTAVDIFGLVVGALGVLHLLTVSAFVGGSRMALTLGDQDISQWGLLALVGIAALGAGACRLRWTGPAPWRRAPIVLASLAALLWLLVAAVELTGMAIESAWLGGAAALIAFAPLAMRLCCLEIGAGLIGCAAIRLIMVDLLAQRANDLEAWISATLVLNSACLMGALILAACGLLLWMGFRTGAAKRGDEQHVVAVGGFMALLLMLVLSFEVDRAVAIFEHSRGERAAERWGEFQLAALWLTLLWALGGAFTAAFALWQRLPRLLLIAGWITTACAVVWLTIDTGLYRVMDGVAEAPVVFNTQFLVGLIIAAELAVIARIAGRLRRPGEPPARIDPVADLVRSALALIACIGLWLGSLEIDRFFNPETSSLTDAAMARQTGLSIWWGVYGIALVVIGFVRRAAMSRYAGLGLLAATLLKVLLVDMSDVEYIYRVLSFIGVGLLFVLTSIAYAKMSPRLLAERAGVEHEPHEGGE